MADIPNDERQSITLNEAAKRAAGVFLITRIIVFVIAYGWLFFGGPHVELGVNEPIWHGDAGGHGRLAEPWRRWDALWFVKVARDGYEYKAGAQSDTSVFPLYPALIDGLGKLGVDHVWAGVVISNLCLYAAVLFLILIVDGCVGNGLGVRAAVSMLLFPCAFVLSGVYSESLFLMCVLGSFYFAGTRRWAFAGLFGMGAALSRFAGVVLVVPLVVALIEEVRAGRARRANFAWVLLVPVGTVLFFAYLSYTTGSYLNYFNAQSHWQKTVTWPWVGLGWEIIPWMWEPNRIINVGSAILFMGLCWHVWRKYGAVWGSYMLAGLAVPMCASRWIGMPRYVLVLWPGFVALADMIKPKWLYWVYVAVSCAGMAWLFVEFAEWRISL